MCVFLAAASSWIASAGAGIIWCLMPYILFSLGSYWRLRIDRLFSLEIDLRFLPGFEVAHLRRLLIAVAVIFVSYGSVYFLL